MQTYIINLEHPTMLQLFQIFFRTPIFFSCFEADIQNDELTFSYKLRGGVAQNMNACFLMGKMGIAIE